MTEGSIALERAPKCPGLMEQCPDACGHRSHTMDGELAGPLRLNPTAIGIKEEEDDLKVTGDPRCRDTGPRRLPWGEPWVP